MCSVARGAHPEQLTVSAVYPRGGRRLTLSSIALEVHAQGSQRGPVCTIFASYVILAAHLHRGGDDEGL